MISASKTPTWVWSVEYLVKLLQRSRLPQQSTIRNPKKKRMILTKMTLGLMSRRRRRTFRNMSSRTNSLPNQQLISSSTSASLCNLLLNSSRQTSKPWETSTQVILSTKEYMAFAVKRPPSQNRCGRPSLGKRKTR